MKRSCQTSTLINSSAWKFNTSNIRLRQILHQTANQASHFFCRLHSTDQNLSRFNDPSVNLGEVRKSRHLPDDLHPALQTPDPRLTPPYVSPSCPFRSRKSYRPPSPTHPRARWRERL